MRRTRTVVLGALTSLAALGVFTTCACSAASESDSATARASIVRPASPTSNAARRGDLESLVPELASHPYRLESGVREFRSRLSVSPGYGVFGTDRLFTLRVGYNPNPWLGYEAAIGHDPGHATHAVLHTISAIFRRPFPGRLQPYVSGGYGMVIVYPGESVNAAPVTKNTLAVGGGLEVYVRNDLALRADLRHATVFGQQRGREGIVAYDYLQGTIGLAFYRSIRP